MGLECSIIIGILYVISLHHKSRLENALCQTEYKVRQEIDFFSKNPSIDESFWQNLRSGKSSNMLSVCSRKEISTSASIKF